MFLELLFKILPMYFTLGLGFLAGRFLNVSRENVANLVIYIIAPVVFTGTLASGQLQIKHLVLPLLTFFIGVVIAGITWVLASCFWKDGTRNLLSASLSVGNTGYFGLPLAMSIFSPSAVGLYVLANFGDVVLHSTVSYYIMARGRFSARQSLQRLFRLPMLYAVPLGIAWNFAGLTLPENVLLLIGNFKGAYATLGMMIIGLALSSMENLRFDFRLLALSNFIRFIIWPALVLILIYIDKSWLHFFGETTYAIYILISVMPVAANATVFSSSLNVHPDKAAAIVLSSTLLALVVIPLAQIFLL